MSPKSLYPNVLSLFLKKVRELKGQPCFRYKYKSEWKTLSWEEVLEKSVRLASSLRDLGIQSGDRIAILSGTRYEWTVIDIAALSLGAVTVPIYHSTLPKDVFYILDHARASVAFVENGSQFKKIDGERKKLTKLKKIISIENHAETDSTLKKLIQQGENETSAFEERINALQEEALATIVYTSGTTGVPKGVSLTHKNLSSEIDALSHILQFNPGDESLLFLPLAHILGRAVQFLQLGTGFVHAYAESIDKLLDNIQETRPHFMVCVPRIFEKIHSKVMGDVETANILKKTLFRWALKVGLEVSQARQYKKSASLFSTLQYEIAQRLVFAKLHEKMGGRMRFFVSGGAPLGAEVAEFFNAAGIVILEGYGLTETVAAINCNTLDQYRFGTVGQPVLHVKHKIASDGEILVKGDHIFEGYYLNPEATQEAFTSDGYFKTGDIGEFDADGFLKITDRKKDIIVTAAGKNIAPQPIENLLKTDPLISHVMVHGDRRKYLSALVTLNPDEAKRCAREKGISFSTIEDLAEESKMIQIIRKSIDEKNKQLASYETIKRFAIIKKDFTIDGGELTPTLKIKRKVVTERYQDVLDTLYQE